MGQTLPNGIYLPAEGERNCYDGLEGNWRSLDSLISTVAGKASATHTHGNITNDGKVGTDANKPLITGTGGAVQAGSFGNQANTFCEGNDSRLSDARTPVAHTHTKSDVTDLLNSNFIPSANNSYDLGSSNYKWKSLNGVNPGALSLPNGVNNDTSWIGDLTILDGSNYNEKTFLNDGWVSINIPGTAGNFILINNGQGQIVSNVGTGVHLNCAITFPVRANTRVYILINIQTGEQVKHAIWTGCAGNV